MAKTATIPESGMVLVGTVNPPTTSVACQVSEVDYQPNAVYNVVPVSGGRDGREVFVGKVPVLTITWLADAGKTNSLSDFLETNEGSTVYVKAKATATAGATYTYQCQAVPGSDLVGRAGEVLVSTVRLPVIARTKA